MSKKDNISLYKKMLLIRRFENRLLDLFSSGELSGTTHTYVGQEAIAVSAMACLEERDIVFSNHRCHGHYLAKEKDIVGLMAEIMGREAGVCAGRGGSQHLCGENFFSNGIQGSYMPIVVGMAMAEKHKKSGSIVVAFIGDGTWGQGVVYESLNLASLWQIPLLIVVEDNGYAQSTPKSINLAGTIRSRVSAFDIECSEIDSSDCAELLPVFSDAVNSVRDNLTPQVVISKTYRFNAHSKGDDDRPIREIEEWRSRRDPLMYTGKELEPEVIAELAKEVEAEIDRAVEISLRSPLSKVKSAL